MVLHVVLFRPRAGVTGAEREAMLAAIRAAARDIPSVRRFVVGERVALGAQYETLAREEYPYAAIVEFESVAGLQQYLQHPAHDALGRLFHQLLDGALVFDYAAEDVGRP